MKPKQAAQLLKSLDRDIAVELLRRMPARQAGAVLGSMKPCRGHARNRLPPTLILVRFNEKHDVHPNTNHGPNRLGPATQRSARCRPARPVQSMTTRPRLISIAMTKFGRTTIGTSNPENGEDFDDVFSDQMNTQNNEPARQKPKLRPLPKKRRT